MNNHYGNGYPPNMPYSMPPMPPQIPPVSGNAPAAKKTYSHIGLALFVFGITSIILQYVLYFVMDTVKIVPEEFQQWLLVIIPMYCIALPILYFMMKQEPASKFEKQKLGFGKWFTIFLCCFPIMITGSIIGSGFMNIISSGNSENPLNEAVEGNFFMKVLVMVILAPIIEEFIFRKLIIDRTEKYGEKYAILFSALSFGLFHMNFYQFFYAFGLGLVFGYVYTRTKDLKYSVFMHMIINFFGSVIAPAAMSGIDFEKLQLLSENPENEELMEQILPGMMAFFGYLLIYGGLIIAGLVLFLIHIKKIHFHISQYQISQEESFSTIYLSAGVILFYLVCIIMIFLNTLSAMIPQGS